MALSASSCERYCSITLDPNLTLVNQLQFFSTIPKLEGERNPRDPS